MDPHFLFARFLAYQEPCRGERGDFGIVKEEFTDNRKIIFLFRVLLSLFHIRCAYIYVSHFILKKRFFYAGKPIWRSFMRDKY